MGEDVVTPAASRNGILLTAQATSAAVTPQAESEASRIMKRLKHEKKEKKRKRDEGGLPEGGDVDKKQKKEPPEELETTDVGGREEEKKERRHEHKELLENDDEKKKRKKRLAAENGVAGEPAVSAPMRSLCKCSREAQRLDAGTE